MGLSFHDESSMMEASIGGLRFMADDPKSQVSENGIINEEEKRHDSEVQLSDDLDIQMVDR